MGHSPQLSGQHGSHIFQSCVVSFKCVLDFQVVSCIIIIIALFFQSYVVSFKCVLDFQVGLMYHNNYFFIFFSYVLCLLNVF